MNPEEYYDRMSPYLEKQGYRFNPDKEFCLELIGGILENRNRYGHDYCPCRLPTGDEDIDRPIICPCDYRDADIKEYGMCYCGLYVGKEWDASKKIKQIPDRWDPDALIDERDKNEYVTKENIADSENTKNNPKGKKLWYCTVCGYVSFREDPPTVCPICKAGSEKFEKLTLDIFKSDT